MEPAIRPDPSEPLDTVLQEQLATAQAVLGTVAPVLRHLIGADANTLFGDEVLAGVRGMAQDLARQLLAAGRDDDAAVSPAVEARLLGELTRNPPLLGHLHALALEWRLTRRLESRVSLDPVLPALVQELGASSDAGTAALAMEFLAAQARFCQAQRRMQLPLHELPGDLPEAAVRTLRTVAGDDNTLDPAEAAIRAGRDRAGSRLALARRVIGSLGDDLTPALVVSNAGVALFLAALSAQTGQDRDAAVLLLTESQAPRLALELRASGMRQADIETLFLALHPDIGLPDGFERLGPEEAAGALATARGDG